MQRVPLIKNPELLNNILEETEELIRIFVASIKTARKKRKIAVKYSILDVDFSFDVGCWTLNVRRSSF